jgi:hypothetical protein
MILYKPFEILTASHRLAFTSLFFIHAQMEVNVVCWNYVTAQTRPDADWESERVTSLAFRTCQARAAAARIPIILVIRFFAVFLNPIRLVAPYLFKFIP